ncbi:tetratricopeptide repeat protein [Acrasis kona]|uniref:Tetratricopeptide repeat protein n=1 Tax=Acrasis kona TaxID=1008807 RepID=A0AAW2YPD9_9EUKA
MDASDIWCRVRRVCVSWHKRATTDFLWKSIYYRTWAVPHKKGGTWWQLFEQRTKLIGQMCNRKTSINKIAEPTDTGKIKVALSSFFQKLKMKSTRPLGEREHKIANAMKELADNKSTFSDVNKTALLVSYCRELLHFNSRNLDAMQALTRVSNVESKHDQVVVYSSEAIDLIEPSQPSSDLQLGPMYFLRGYALYKQEMYKESLNDYNKAEQHGFKKFTLFYCRMFNHVKLKQLDKAYEDSLMVINKKNAKNSEKKFPNAKLGDYLYRQGKLAESRAYFLLSNNKNNKVIALKRLLEIDCRLKDYRNAVRWWCELVLYCHHNAESAKQEGKKNGDIKSLYKIYRTNIKACRMNLATDDIIEKKATSALHNLCAYLELSLTTTIPESFDDQFLNGTKFIPLLVKYDLTKVMQDQLDSLKITQREEATALAKSYENFLKSIAIYYLSKVQEIKNGAHVLQYEKYLQKSFSTNSFLRDRFSPMEYSQDIVFKYD